jgi:hypothetical protein
MTKMAVSEIIDQLSPEARLVLEGMSDRIGTTIPHTTQAVVGELLKLDVIGARSGLTITGSAVVCKIKPELPF